MNKNISSIQYNSLNLPAQILFADGNAIRYMYSADGHKLRAEYTTAMPATTKTVDYCGNLIFENGTLKQILVDGGYIMMDDWSHPYCFYAKDHLGNNRIVVHQTGTVEQVNNYYPYGGLMANSTGWNAQRYKYNGKELDRMHGLDWYDYGARWQDAALSGRWHAMDPLCEKYYDVTPYGYCKGNPIILIDMNGCEPDSLAAAEMCALAYGPNEKYTKDLVKKGWFVCYSNSSNSGLKSKMFRKSVGKGRYEYCLAFAGTDTENGFIEAAKDIFADISNFFGAGSMQHFESIAAAFGVLSRMDKKTELTFTGHSLGGGLATMASSVTGRNAIIFNSASLSGLTGGIARISSLFMGGRIKHYRANGDYVNVSQDITRRPVQAKTQFINTHKLLSHKLDDIIKAFKQ